LFLHVPEHAHPCLFLYQLVWLKRFKTFEDKSSAITQNAGVNKKLSQMIQKGHSPWMKLAVGNPEYKQIIEDHLVSTSSWFAYIVGQLRSPVLLC
jgi:hypothetical protein